MDIRIDYSKYPLYRLELKLTNGQKVVKEMTWPRVYNLKEKRRTIIQMDNKFPFIHFQKKPYVKFRYADTWNSFTDEISDSRYNLDCSLATFLNMFQINYKHWSEISLKAAIETGEE